MSFRITSDTLKSKKLHHVYFTFVCNVTYFGRGNGLVQCIDKIGYFACEMKKEKC